jgi:hypothetical protein
MLLYKFSPAGYRAVTLEGFNNAANWASHRREIMQSRTRMIMTTLIAASVMGASALTFAEPAKPSAEEHRAKVSRARFDAASFADRRLARLKADLKLTADQEPLWQAFADQARAEAGKGMKAMREVAEDASLSAPERGAREIAILKERVVALEAVNEKFRHLYDVLTPEQKRVADIDAARMTRGKGDRRGRHFDHGGVRGRGAAPAPADDSNG